MNNKMRQLHSYKSKWTEYKIRVCTAKGGLLLIKRTEAKINAVNNRSSQKTWLLFLLINDGKLRVSGYEGSNCLPANKYVPHSKLNVKCRVKAKYLCPHECEVKYDGRRGKQLFLCLRK